MAEEGVRVRLKIEQGVARLDCNGYYSLAQVESSSMLCKGTSDHPPRRVTLQEQASPVSPARGPLVPTPPLSQAAPGRGVLRRGSFEQTPIASSPAPPTHTLPLRPVPVPTLVPSYVKSNEQVQLIVPDQQVLSECRRSGSTFDVLEGATRRKLFNAYIGNRRGRRTLELAAVGNEEDPFCTVCSPDPSKPSIFMEVLGAKYELFGILEFHSGKLTASLKVEGQHVMGFNFEEHKWSAHAPSGTAVAVASMISSVPPHWKLVVEPKYDSILICACILGGVVLRTASGGTPSIARRMPRSYHRSSSTGDFVPTASGGSSHDVSLEEERGHEREAMG